MVTILLNYIAHLFAQDNNHKINNNNNKNNHNNKKYWENTEHFKITSVLVIVGAPGMIKRETDKHIYKIPGCPSRYEL